RGPADGTDLGGGLAGLLRIDADDKDLRLLRGRHRHAFGDRVVYLVGVAELEIEVPALHRRAVADAGDLQLALVTLSDPGDELGGQRAIGTPHGAGALAIVHGIDRQLVRLDFGRDIAVQDELELALRALHLEGLALDIGGNPRRDRDRLLSDTRHGSIPFVSASLH